MSCPEEDTSIAPKECQPQSRSKSDPCCGGTRSRSLCGIRTPFWWYGGRDGQPRPGGDPDEYEPRPRRLVRLAEDIPNVLERLEVDCVHQYLPGQISATSAGRGATRVAEDGVDEKERAERASHEHCPCRRETWVRGGPLLGHRPDPAKGCQCACCRAPRPPRPAPPRAPPASPAPPRETWCPRPPFWWWCHDKRSQRPCGDPSLYAPVFPAKQPQPETPLEHKFELDHPDFYLPGQVVFGFKPALRRYAEPEDCPDDYLSRCGLEPTLPPPRTQRCGAIPSCSDHGGHPWHPAYLPSLLESEVAGARCSAPPRALRRPTPCTCATEACTTCCRHSVDEM
ncbi:uncharacterized protein LOC117650614 [Thrips palmi]|uniref:Uncharacterized protein LOC117650614 n=1 Tax=Thrips palmi TaxID=161013 RepID=A0A6P8ZY60_THRPL|nr:uncharacterized protein LOC117650614 [Thrips palmi]